MREWTDKKDGRWLWSLRRLCRSRPSRLIGGYDLDYREGDASCSGAPRRQTGCSLHRGLVSDGVSPFSEKGLDEAFCFAIGPRPARPGEAVANAEVNAKFSKGPGAIAASVVGEDGVDVDAERPVVLNRCEQEGCRRGMAFIHQDAREGQLGMIVDGNMDKLPTDSAYTRLLRSP